MTLSTRSPSIFRENIKPNIFTKENYRKSLKNNYPCIIRNGKFLDTCQSIIGKKVDEIESSKINGKGFS
jgi:hypothetical protein